VQQNFRLIRVLFRKRRRKQTLSDFIADGKIILKYFLEKQFVGLNLIHTIQDMDQFWFLSDNMRNSCVSLRREGPPHWLSTFQEELRFMYLLKALFHVFLIIQGGPKVGIHFIVYSTQYIVYLLMAHSVY
jgi:hypothetical protein